MCLLAGLFRILVVFNVSNNCEVWVYTSKRRDHRRLRLSKRDTILHYLPGEGITRTQSKHTLDLNVQFGRRSEVVVKRGPLIPVC